MLMRVVCVCALAHMRWERNAVRVCGVVFECGGSCVFLCGCGCLGRGVRACLSMYVKTKNGGVQRRMSLLTCIYIYIYTCICVWVCIHTDTHTHIHSCTHTHTHTQLQTGGACIYLYNVYIYMYIFI